MKRWYVVWQFHRSQSPLAILATFGPVAIFESEQEARAFAKAGHPMKRGWYRVVEGGN